MALIATYKSGSVVTEQALLRISRIWGGKKEKWNAWVEVFSDEDGKNLVANFSVTTEYVEDENPYIALYNQICELGFVYDIKSDDKNFSKPKNEKPKRKARVKKKST